METAELCNERTMPHAQSALSQCAVYTAGRLSNSLASEEMSN